MSDKEEKTTEIEREKRERGDGEMFSLTASWRGKAQQKKTNFTFRNCVECEGSNFAYV